MQGRAEDEIHALYPQDFDHDAWEVEAKGYCDADVRVDDSLISVGFYEPTRLRQ